MAPDSQPGATVLDQVRDLIKAIAGLSPALIIAFAILIFVVALSIVLTVAAANRWKQSIFWGLKPPWVQVAPATANPAAEDQLHRALERLADLGQALVAVAEAPSSDERTRREWFQYLLEGLSGSLARGNGDHFRIGIYTVAGDDPNLHVLAQHNFDRSDARLKTLERRTTVAGWVVENGEPHYVPDVNRDSIYRKRKTRPSYKSMYAVPLGPPETPWGAMTIDVNRADGMTDTQQEIVRAFGDVASLGASLANMELQRPEPDAAEPAHTAAGIVKRTRAKEGSRDAP